MKRVFARLRRVLAVAFALGGCTMTKPTSMSTPVPSRTSSSALAVLAGEYWEKRMQADPIEATLLGDRRFDDRLPDPSPEEDRRETARLRALADRVRAIDLAMLNDADRVTRAALLGEVDNDLAARACAISDW